MKKFLSLLLALSMVMALVACGSNNAGNTTENKPADSTQTETPSTPDTTTPASEPIKNLVNWQTSGANEMGVFLIQNSESQSESDVLSNCYSPLLEVNNKGQLGPAVATEWGTEDGGMTWTFKLRDDVTWVDMDGNYKADCNAQDWLTAMEWVLNFHKNGAMNTSMPFALIAGAQDYYDYTKNLTMDEAYALTKEGKFAEMVGIEAPDDYTLIYHCTKNAPYFDTLATCGCLYPMAQGMIDEVGVANVLAIDNTNMWYNGAYTLTSYIQNNEKTLTKNESYYDKDCTLFDTVTVRMIADGNTDDQLYETGEVDRATLSEATLNRIYEDQSHPLHNYLVECMPTKYSYDIFWNFAKNNEDGTPDTNNNAAFANEAFRLSLTYGLDMRNYWARTNSINPNSCECLAFTMKGLLYFSDGTEYVSKVVEQLGYTEKTDGTPTRLDMEKATAYKEQAMTELAGKVSFPVELDYYIKAGNQTALDGAIVIKEMFEALGSEYVTVNILTYASSASQEVYKPKLHSFVISGWGADYGDPENFINQMVYGRDDAYHSRTYTCINDVDPAAAPELIAAYEEFTALADKASGIFMDTDERYQAYVDAEVYMIEHGLLLPAYYNISWQLTKINDYSKKNAMFGAQNNMYKNWETSVDGYTTEQYEQFKADYNA